MSTLVIIFPIAHFYHVIFLISQKKNTVLNFLKKKDV